MARHRTDVPVVTDAARSRDEEFIARRNRYLFTMAMRVVALLLACAVVTWNVWVGVSIALIGTVLPWIAVVMANDAPPKKKIRPAAGHPNPERALPAGGKIIDAEPGKTADDESDGLP